MRIVGGVLSIDGLSSPVICRLQAFRYEFGLLWAGWVNHAEGHPYWHPIVPLDSRPLTLVTDDGQELKIYLRNEQGFFQSA
jgi:hypothetical protein